MLNLTSVIEEVLNERKESSSEFEKYLKTLNSKERQEFLLNVANHIIRGVRL